MTPLLWTLAWFGSAFVALLLWYLAYKPVQWIDVVMAVALGPFALAALAGIKFCEHAEKTLIQRQRK